MVLVDSEHHPEPGRQVEVQDRERHGHTSLERHGGLAQPREDARAQPQRSSEGQGARPRHSVVALEPEVRRDPAHAEHPREARGQVGASLGQRQPERERTHEVERAEDRAGDETESDQVDDRDQAWVVVEAAQFVRSKRERAERHQQTRVREAEVQERRPPGGQERLRRLSLGHLSPNATRVGRQLGAPRVEPDAVNLESR